MYSKTGKDFPKIVRAGMERACEDFTKLVEPLGFCRSRKMIWVRRHTHTLDCISFFREGSTYGPISSGSVAIRISCSIRVINDDFVSVSLNGPTSGPKFGLRNGNYHLRFNADTGSTYERCVQDLIRFVQEQGEPWFQKFRSPEVLLTSSDSPLKAKEKEFLQEALEGHSNTERVDATFKIYGIKAE